ncbi:hypothetical protein ACA040_004372 [Xenophilus aerolatus]
MSGLATRESLFARLKRDVPALNPNLRQAVLDAVMAELHAVDDALASADAAADTLDQRRPMSARQKTTP